MIARSEYARRRRELMRMAGGDAAVVVAAAPERMRNADAAYPYRQDSDFHYLSGFAETDAVLALLPGRAHGQAVMFCRERDSEQERWHGPRVGTEGAVASYGMDDAFPIDDIDDILPGMLEGRTRLYCHFGREPEFDARLLAWMRRLRAARGGGVVPRELMALGHLLHEQRLYKSPGELKALRRAAEIAAEAHHAAMRATRPGAAEYEVEAELLRVLHARGAVPSYPPIVAAGANACVLHYASNRARMAAGDLLLLDAGAEWQCYASDITRTWPVGGRYSRAQRALYDVVLAAQQAAIAEVRPGRPWNACHDAAVRVIAAGLCDLGLLPGDPAAAIESGSYQRFFMHKTGHWLGLDVHDVGDYRVDGESRLLEPGMVVTVEPGLYVPVDAEDVPARYRGIGIRIEDDVAVTAHAPDILSSGVPSAPAEIEALLAAGHG
ncbi:MAG: aminopeptidase P N-terminal domain-containing protein [Xanthomonadaceae bacterium]|nr:aminopeptidase P N-terminal domain-containing protein [Xanthomonadaceae bacterium]MDE2176715.1 aminopeptidase P N-terminal domain-containing protein [Xanthomonadaceae bacterium]MDE2245406.1 aminopeptidase P N-terminal domain-containing protein [Xanthomonadaceae bacterium]